MRDNRRDLLILGTLPPPLHGASLYFQNLAESDVLHRAYRVRFLNLDLKNRLNTYQRFTAAKALRTARCLAAYLGILARNKVDLVYAQIAFPKVPFIKDSLFALAARLFRTRIVGAVVGQGLRANYEAASRLMKGYYRWIGGLYTAFISPGWTMSRNDFRGIIPPDRVDGVPFGIVPAFPGPSRPEPDEKARRVVFMSHFLRSKGVFDALRAVKAVCRKHPDAEFKFAGEWQTESDRREAEEILRVDGVADRVEFVGLVEGREKRALLSGAQIFILPTYYEYEGLPLALLEAMSYGHCLVTTDHAAIGEAVKEGRNGYLCEKRNPADLARKILTAMDDEATTFAMRRTNWEDFGKYYTLPRYIERLIAALDRHMEPSCGS
jgi:glycosyltransferase involved in cell wall biosynthesis